jgi:hypothetical protein
MLVVAQLPMADVRPFLTQQTHRLERPRWGAPLSLTLTSGFVRNVGELRRRRGGGDMSWENEGFYCDASRALPLPTDLPSHKFGPADAPIAAFKGSSRVGSRRYYSSGPIVRIEVGLSRIWGPHKLAGLGLNQFLESMLSLPLSVRHATGPQPQPLHAAGPSLAALVLASTTQRNTGAAFQPESWWVSPGRPMLFVEYHVGEVANPPKTGREVYLPEADGLRLDHWWTTFNQHRVQAWLLGRTLLSYRDQLRQVRVHLMRLHAELECAMQVLQLAHDGGGSPKVSPPSGTQEAAALVAYLERLQRLLSRQNVYGHPQAPILVAALAAHFKVDPDDWVAVREVLEDLMRQAEGLKNQVSYPL